MTAWSAAGAVVLLIGLVGVTLLRSVDGRDAPAPGGDSIPTVEQPDQISVGNDELASLVAAHSSALKRHDERAYLSIYDQKDEKLIASQRRLYRNLLKVPFKAAEYQVTQQSGHQVDNFGRGVKLSVDVAFVHQIKGVDVTPVQEWYHWTVVKDSPDAPLTVTAVSGAVSVNGERRTVYYPAPWDIYPDLTVVTTPHAVILANSATAGLARRLAPTVERSAVADLNVWKARGPKGVPTQPGFLVVFENSRKRVRAMYRAGESVPTNEAGFSLGMASAELSDAPPGGSGSGQELTYGGSRIVVDTTTGYFTSHGRAGTPQEILRHEMAHSLLQPLEAEPGLFDNLLGTGLRTWAVEGFADYMAYRDRPVTAGHDAAVLRQQVRSGRFKGRLPTNKEINNGKTLSVAGYAQGYFAIRFIAEKYGEGRALAFVAAHYRDPQHLNEEIRDATGLSLAAFQARWARYVRAAVG